jgi:hypothetical protein
MRLVTVEPHPPYLNIDVHNYSCDCSHSEDFFVAHKIDGGTTERSSPLVEKADQGRLNWRPRHRSAQLRLDLPHRPPISKRKGSRYRSGRSDDWLKTKNRNHPAATRNLENWHG